MGVLIAGVEKSCGYKSPSQTSIQTLLPISILIVLQSWDRGCPVKLRTDCGTENGEMAAMQCTFQQDADAHKYGTAVAEHGGQVLFCSRNSFSFCCRTTFLAVSLSWI